MGSPAEEWLQQLADWTTRAIEAAGILVIVVGAIVANTISRKPSASLRQHDVGRSLPISRLS